MWSYEQTYIDGSFVDNYERDIHNLEILIAKSGDVLIMVSRSIDWNSYNNGVEIITDTYGSDLDCLVIWDILKVLPIILSAGLSYAIEISSDSEYDDDNFDPQISILCKCNIRFKRLLKQKTLFTLRGLTWG